MPALFVVDACRIKAGPTVNLTFTGLPLQTTNSHDRVLLVNIEDVAAEDADEDEFCNTFATNASWFIPFDRLSSALWRSRLSSSSGATSGRFVVCYFSAVLSTWLRFTPPSCRYLSIDAAKSPLANVTLNVVDVPRAGRPFTAALDVFGARPAEDRLLLLAVADNASSQGTCAELLANTSSSNVLATIYTQSVTSFATGVVAASMPSGNGRVSSAATAESLLADAAYHRLVFGPFVAAIASEFLVCLAVFPHETLLTVGRLSVVGAVTNTSLVGNVSRQGHPATFHVAGLGIDVDRDVFFVSNDSACDWNDAMNANVTHRVRLPLPLALPEDDPETDNASRFAIEANLTVELLLPDKAYVCYASHRAPHLVEAALQFVTSPVEPNAFLPVATATALHWAVGQDAVVALVGDTAVDSRLDRLFLRPIGGDDAAAANESSCMDADADAALQLKPLAVLFPEISLPTAPPSLFQLPLNNSSNNSSSSTTLRRSRHPNVFVLPNVSQTGDFALCYRPRYAPPQAGFIRVGGVAAVSVRPSFFRVADGRQAVTIGETVGLIPEAFALGHGASRSVFLMDAVERECRNATALQAQANTSTDGPNVSALTSVINHPVSLTAAQRGVFVVCWATASGPMLRSAELLAVAPISPVGLSLQHLRSMLATVVWLVGGRGVDLVAAVFPDRVVVCPEALRASSAHNGTATLVPVGRETFTATPDSLDPVDLCFVPGIQAADSNESIRFLGSLSVLPGVRNMTAEPSFIERGQHGRIVVHGVGLRPQDTLRPCSPGNSTANRTLSTASSATLELVEYAPSRTVWHVAVSDFSGLLRLCYFFFSPYADAPNASSKVVVVEGAAVPEVVVPVNPLRTTTFAPTHTPARTLTTFFLADAGSVLGGIRRVFFADTGACAPSAGTAGARVASTTANSGVVQLRSNPSGLQATLLSPDRGQYYLCVETVSNATYPIGAEAAVAIDGNTSATTPAPAPTGSPRRVAVLPFVASAGLVDAGGSPFTDVPFAMQFQGGDLNTGDAMFLVPTAEACTAEDDTSFDDAGDNNATSQQQEEPQRPSSRVLGTVKSSNAATGTLTVEFVVPLFGTYKPCAILDQTTIGQLQPRASPAANGTVRVSSSLVYDAVQQLLVLRGPSLALNQAASTYIFYYTVVSSPGALMQLVTEDAAKRTPIADLAPNPYAFFPFLPFGLVEFSCDVLIGSTAVRAHRLQLNVSVNATFCRVFPHEPAAVRLLSWTPDSLTWLFAATLVLLHDFNTAQCAAQLGAVPPIVAQRDYLLGLVATNPELVTAPLFVFMTLAWILADMPPIALATVDAARNLLEFSEASLSLYTNASVDRLQAHLVIVDAVKVVLLSNTNNSLMAVEVQRIAIAMYQRLQLITAKACSSDAVQRTENSTLALSILGSALTVSLDPSNTALASPSVNVTTFGDFSGGCIASAPLLGNVLPQGQQPQPLLRRDSAELALARPATVGPDGTVQLPVFSLLATAFIPHAAFQYGVPPDVMAHVLAATPRLPAVFDFTVTAILKQFVFNADGASGYWVPLPTATTAVSGDGARLRIHVTASTGSQRTKRGDMALLVSGVFVLRPNIAPFQDHRTDWFLVGWTGLLGILQLVVFVVARRLHHANKQKRPHEPLAPPTAAVQPHLRPVLAVEHDESSDFEEVVFEFDDADAPVVYGTVAGPPAKPKDADLLSVSSNGRGVTKEQQQPHTEPTASTSLGTRSSSLSSDGATLTTRELQQRKRQKSKPSSNTEEPEAHAEDSNVPASRWGFPWHMRRTPLRSAVDSTFSFAAAWVMTLMCVYLLERSPAFPPPPPPTLPSLRLLLQNVAVCGVQSAVAAAVCLGVTRSMWVRSLSSLVAALAACVVGAAVLLQPSLSSERISLAAVAAACAAIAVWLAMFVVRWLFASFASCGDVVPPVLASRGAKRALRGATVTLTLLLSGGAAAATLYIALVPGTLLVWRPLFDHFQAIAVALLADAVLDAFVSRAKRVLDRVIHARRQRYLLRTKVDALLSPRRGHATAHDPPTKRLGDPAEPFFASDDASTVYDAASDDDEDVLLEKSDAGTFVLQFHADHSSSSDHGDYQSIGSDRRTPQRKKMPTRQGTHLPFDDADFELPVGKPTALASQHHQSPHDAFVLVDEIDGSDDGSDTNDGHFDSIQSSPMAADTAMPQRRPAAASAAAFHRGKSPLDEISNDSDWEFDEADNARLDAAVAAARVMQTRPAAPPTAPTGGLQRRTVSLAAIATDVLRSATKATTTEEQLYTKFRLGAKSFRAVPPSEGAAGLGGGDGGLRQLQSQASMAFFGGRDYGGDVEDPSPIHSRGGAGARRAGAPSQPPPQNSFVIDVEMAQSEGDSSYPSLDDTHSTDPMQPPHRQPTSHAFDGSAALSRRNLRAAGLDTQEARNPFQFDFSAVQQYE